VGYRSPVLVGCDDGERGMGSSVLTGCVALRGVNSEVEKEGNFLRRSVPRGHAWFIYKKLLPSSRWGQKRGTPFGGHGEMVSDGSSPRGVGDSHCQNTY